MPVEFACPKCRARMNIDYKGLGKQVLCAQCRHLFFADDPADLPGPNIPLIVVGVLIVLLSFAGLVTPYQTAAALFALFGLLLAGLTWLSAQLRRIEYTLRQAADDSRNGSNR